MIVLDTHAWLWWHDLPGRLSPRARQAIEQSDRVGISAMTAWELAMLATRGRIELDRPVEQWIGQSLARERAAELPVTSEIAARAALLGEEGFPPDPADRIIYATAKAERAPLVTRDEALRAFDPDRTVW